MITTKSLSLNCSSSVQLQVASATSRSWNGAQVTTRASRWAAWWDDGDGLLQGVLVFHYVTISRHLYSFGLPGERLGRVTLIQKGPSTVDPISNHIRFMEINPSRCPRCSRLLATYKCKYTRPAQLFFQDSPEKWEVGGPTTTNVILALSPPTD